MNIGKKLYWGFGAILGLLLLLYAVNTTALWRADSARKAAMGSLDTMRGMEAVRLQMMTNRQFLDSYLLAGVPGELEKFRAGTTDLESKLKKREQ